MVDLRCPGDGLHTPSYSLDSHMSHMKRPQTGSGLGHQAGDHARERASLEGPRATT